MDAFLAVPYFASLHLKSMRFNVLTNTCLSCSVSSEQLKWHCIDKSGPVKLAHLVDHRCLMAVDGAIVLCVMAMTIGSTIAYAIRSHH